MNIPYHIFPVGPHKRPLIKDWQTNATMDPDQIAAWKAQGVKAWGIPTGARNGLFVIDLDVNKNTGERLGELMFKEAPNYAHLLKHINVRTPSGGAHMYFQHFDGARNTTGKLGPKVDTRGEGGYVIAPGSVTEGGTYEGRCPPLPPVPFGIRAMLLRQPPAPKPSFDRETPTGEVQELLRHIPADCTYGDWVAVLMALHSRYGGSEEGLAIADGWSATGSKYRPGEVTAKWRSFKGAGVTWATIPALARQNGADLYEISKRWAA